jgi:hypothetical protein
MVASLAVFLFTIAVFHCPPVLIIRAVCNQNVSLERLFHTPRSVMSGHRSRVRSDFCALCCFHYFASLPMTSIAARRSHSSAARDAKHLSMEESSAAVSIRPQQELHHPSTMTTTPTAQEHPQRLMILSQENEALRETIRLLRQELRNRSTTTQSSRPVSMVTTPPGEIAPGYYDHHEYASSRNHPAGLKHRKSPSKQQDNTQQPLLPFSFTSSAQQISATSRANHPRTTPPRTLSSEDSSSPSGRGKQRLAVDAQDDVDVDMADVESSYCIDLERQRAFLLPPPSTPKRVMTPETIANTTLFDDYDDNDVDDDDHENDHVNHHHRHHSSFLHSVKDRGIWLIGLLLLQSLSSFIIRRNEALLRQHIIIVQFLTMLVGAGGNGGNQGTNVSSSVFVGLFGCFFFVLRKRFQNDNIIVFVFADGFVFCFAYHSQRQGHSRFGHGEYPRRQLA